MIERAFRAGWGGAVVKTMTWEAVKNVANRFAVSKIKGNVFVFENIELLSERTPEQWFRDIACLKQRFPKKVVIGSIMSDTGDKDGWLELAAGCQEAGADAVELNFSCPHGYPERGLGAAIGQNPAIASKIVTWLSSSSIHIPIIPKLTACVGDISLVGEHLACNGADGLTAINTFPSFIGFDLRTLNPRPEVGGCSTTGGYSGPGLKPIALRCLYDLITSPGLPVMACGGISSGFDAAEFMLMGSPIVQACTEVMLNGYGVIERFKNELQGFMRFHGFSSPADFIGQGYPRIKPYSKLDNNIKMVARIDPSKCNGCMMCLIACRDAGYKAIEAQENLYAIDQGRCRGCSLCSHICRRDAIDMVECAHR
jgi:dihydropyrimidine dehydrogenase (NAD+) subunit PreA